jgi:hypothetical protein
MPSVAPVNFVEAAMKPSLEKFLIDLAASVETPTEKFVHAAIILAREWSKRIKMPQDRFIELCLAESTDLNTDKFVE